MTKTLRYFSLLICPLLLSSCVSLTPPPAATQFKKESKLSRQAQLQAIRHWNIGGALSIKQKDKAQIANFSWKLQSKSNYKIRISSTLNVYNIQIQAKAGQLTLNQNNKAPLHAQTPQELMQKAVGFALPINNLYYWVRGLAAPGKSKPSFDQYGHLTRLSQQGWQIRFMRYTHVNTLDLPQLVQLSRENLTIRIVIKRWAI